VPPSPSKLVKDLNRLVLAFPYQQHRRHARKLPLLVLMCSSHRFVALLEIFFWWGVACGAVPLPEKESKTMQAVELRSNQIGNQIKSNMVVCPNVLVPKSQPGRALSTLAKEKEPFWNWVLNKFLHPNKIHQGTMIVVLSLHAAFICSQTIGHWHSWRNCYSEFDRTFARTKCFITLLERCAKWC